MWEDNLIYKKLENPIYSKYKNLVNSIRIIIETNNQYLKLENKSEFKKQLSEIIYVNWMSKNPFSKYYKNQKTSIEWEITQTEIKIFSQMDTILEEIYQESKNYSLFYTNHQENKAELSKMDMTKISVEKMFPNWVFIKVHINYRSKWFMKNILYANYQKIEITDPELALQIEHRQKILPDWKVINILLTNPVYGNIWKYKRRKFNLRYPSKKYDPSSAMAKYIQTENLKVQFVDAADHSTDQNQTLNFLKKMQTQNQSIQFVNYRSCGGSWLYGQTLDLIDWYHVMWTDWTWNPKVNNMILSKITKMQETWTWIDFKELKTKIDAKAKRSSKFIQKRYKDYKFAHQNTLGKIELYARALLGG